MHLELIRGEVMTSLLKKLSICVHRPNSGSRSVLEVTLTVCVWFSEHYWRKRCKLGSPETISSLKWLTSSTFGAFTSVSFFCASKLLLRPSAIFWGLIWQLLWPKWEIYVVKLSFGWPFLVLPVFFSRRCCSTRAPQRFKSAPMFCQLYQITLGEPFDFFIWAAFGVTN